MIFKGKYIVKKINICESWNPKQGTCSGFMKQKWKYILKEKIEKKRKQKEKEIDTEASKMLFIIN